MSTYVKDNALSCDLFLWGKWGIPTVIDEGKHMGFSVEMTHRYVLHNDGANIGYCVML